MARPAHFEDADVRVDKLVVGPYENNVFVVRSKHTGDAVLLDAALQVIERERGIDLTQWHIASIKFLDVVRPGDALRLEHEARQSGLIRFTVRVADRTVASGSLSL